LSVSYQLKHNKHEKLRAPTLLKWKFADVSLNPPASFAMNEQAFLWAEEARREEEAKKIRKFFTLTMAGCTLPIHLRTLLIYEKIKFQVSLADDDTVKDLKILVVAALKLPKGHAPSFYMVDNSRIDNFMNDEMAILRTFPIKDGSTINFRIVDDDSESTDSENSDSDESS
jgi:hypothetical protein